jgi:predicted metalloprotease with PDZ domain
MQVACRNGRELVTVVHADSPAAKSGLAPGDELVALGEVRLTAVNFDARLREYHVGDRVTISVFRNDELLKFKLRLAPAPEDTCYLEITGDPSAWL